MSFHLDFVFRSIFLASLSKVFQFSRFLYCHFPLPYAFQAEEIFPAGEDDNPHKKHSSCVPTVRKAVFCARPHLHSHRVIMKIKIAQTSVPTGAGTEVWAMKKVTLSSKESVFTAPIDDFLLHSI